MKPQFLPTGGIGSTYKDPKTGEVYKFTAQGWLLQSSDIKEESDKKETFEVKPEEKDLVEELKAGGSSQPQINQGLMERARVLSNLKQQGQVEKVETEGEISWDDYLGKAEEYVGRSLTGEEKNELRIQYNENIGEAPAIEQDTSHPFGGMNKQEMLRDAFNKGVTSTTELKKLSTLYDMLVEEENENEDFTDTELRKLEQAGLINATRQEKLDYLYGD
ncbi:MAG: hypothetical protein PHW33_04700 [Candidatus Portnoybacteria bacterium]|jgi:hypothetical protein|nr:hypothetical protein [Candidatus Portnoybacteria bacterium]